jgi:2-dehydro-3-deoxygluconokinase
MNKVLCFGELLLRMSPSSCGNWLRKGSIPVYTGGAELNVAAGLAKWDIPVSFFTALPDNYMSKAIGSYLLERRIDISTIQYSGSRIGIYFLPQGTDLKNEGVIYDRDYSSFSELKPGNIDWEKLFENVSWFHFSAIIPALNENSLQVCKKAIREASKRGIIVSVDLNYRSKLWQYGKSPVQAMPELVDFCDVIMGNIWSANIMLGIGLDENIHHKGGRVDYMGHAKQTAMDIQLRYPKCKTVANTFRFDLDNNGLLYYASLFHDGMQFNSPEFCARAIVDRVGSGDCFMAGLIYGLYHQHPPQEIVNFATSAAFGKMQEAGDFTDQDIEKIYARLQKNG